MKQTDQIKRNIDLLFEFDRENFDILALHEDSKGNTVFELEIARNRSEYLEKILNSGNGNNKRALLQHESRLYSYTPLMQALARRTSLDIVQQLLDFGADP